MKTIKDILKSHNSYKESLALELHEYVEWRVASIKTGYWDWKEGNDTLESLLEAKGKKGNKD
jgi:hypothetical protein